MCMCSELAKLHSVAPPTTEAPPPHVDKYERWQRAQLLGPTAKGSWGLHGDANPEGSPATHDKHTRGER